MAKKEKLFKLGENATLFVDAATGLKISGKEAVLVTGEQQASQKFKQAKKFGHLVEPSDDDIEDEVEEENDGISAEDREELDAFNKLKVEEMKTKILDDYELTEEEQAEISGLKKPDLIEKFKALLLETE